MAKGKLAYMPQPGTVEFREYDLPVPEPGALLVETVAAGVCGSDLHMWEGRHPLKSIVLGHEMVGRVIDATSRPVDSSGEPLVAGDLVSATYFAFCGHCRACSRGQTHLCERGYHQWTQSPDDFPHFTGTFGTHYYIDRDQSLYKVPANVPALVAVSASCALSQASVGIHRARVKAGDTVVVQGAGGLGLWATARAKERGAKVIVVDAVERRLQSARAFGADETVSFEDFPDAHDRIDRVRELSEGGADSAIELTGVPAAVLEGVEMVRTGGTYIVIGNVTPGPTIALDIGSLVRRSVTIHPVIRYPQYILRDSLQFLSRNMDRLPFDQLVDATYPFDNLLDALEDSRSHAVNRAAVVMS